MMETLQYARLVYGAGVVLELAPTWAARQRSNPLPIMIDPFPPYHEPPI